MTTKIPNAMIVKIAAFSGCDVRSVRKYALSDPHTPISNRAGAPKVRDAVIQAARALGVRP